MELYWFGAILILLGIGIIGWDLRHRHAKFSAGPSLVIKKLAGDDARTDLPAEVAAWAARLGVLASVPSAYIGFAQKGTIKTDPKGSWRPFMATQWVSTAHCGFSWYAHAGPRNILSVIDYFVNQQGGLRIWLLGLFPLVKSVGTSAISRGELIRYLAEIPFCPDAILFNHELDWSVVSPTSFKVAAGVASTRAEVTFTLDDKGLAISFYNYQRNFGAESGSKIYPWHGEFKDYTRCDGRLIPLGGEVGWELPTGYFSYFQGEAEGWKAY